MHFDRRSFLGSTSVFAVAALGLSPERAWSQDRPAVPPTYPTHPPELAKEMVGASHSNLARVKELLALQPNLARAAWDWGFGDWEDALGAASHVGNREIAAVLLAHGARPTIFSAAMLGQLDVVKAFLAAAPGIEATPGPHGIPLLAHATAGGPAAEATAAYLKTLPSANTRPATTPLSADEMKALTGEYGFGPGATEVITIAISASANVPTLTRLGGSARNLFHVGDRAFFPVGAPLVRVRFEAAPDGMRLTVHDPAPVLVAVRRAG